MADIKEYTKKELTDLLAEKDDQIQELQKDLELMQRKEEDLRRELAVTMREVEKARDDFNTIENAFFWKITKPARRVADRMKKPVDLGAYAHLPRRVITSVREHGLVFTLKKIKTRLSDAPTYTQWMKKHRPSEEELRKQRSTHFDKSIKFSILVPLFNTPEQFLKEMIESVQAQTYGDWELCMADGSNSDHPEVESICAQYVNSDSRIKYKKLTENLGISGNTNACLDLVTGDYIALFDHDDILHPSALFEMMKVIDEKDADIVYTDEATFISPDINKIKIIHFKPDFAPDNLRANNYICHFTAFKRSLLEQAGAFRSEYDGSQDHDLILRLTEVAGKIEHIPQVLYYWRAHPASVALSSSSKDYAAVAGRKAVHDSIERMGMTATVESSRILSSIYRIKYDIEGKPKISIVIPTCDHADMLRKCIESIESKSTYGNYEIIIVENNSKEKETFALYKELENKYNNVKVIYWEREFNYSAINNFGVKEAASGEYILLLNNDIEVITPDWMEEMLMYAQRKDVGAVGAKLLYPDNTVQHGGVILGRGGIANHMFYGLSSDDPGYMGRMCYAQNMSAVTAACMLVRRDVWEDMEGLDEGYPVAFNDVDFCMRIRKAGYLIVWTPYAELYHYESKSRGRDDDTPEKRSRFLAEHVRFEARWSEEMESCDPYYNPNFTHDARRRDFTLE